MLESIGDLSDNNQQPGKAVAHRLPITDCRATTDPTMRAWSTL